MGKYLIKVSDDRSGTIIDADSLERFIEATRDFTSAMANLPEGEPYDVDAAVGVAFLSPYIAEALARLVGYDAGASL